MRRGVVVFSIVLVAAASLVFLARTQPPAAPGPRGVVGSTGSGVAIVYLQGSISEGRQAMSALGTITPRLVARYLERLEVDASVGAVVLRVDSPGGSVAASQAIAGMIRRFPKPIVVSMGDMAASGGYYISAPADRIVALPGTMTGSIGVITTVTDLGGLYEKLGIREEVVKSGEHKDMYHRALTPEEREIMQQLSDAAYEQFIEAVAEGRGMSVERVRELATGELFIGSRAKELGLVDSLGDLDDAVRIAAELAGIASPRAFEVPPPAYLGRFWGLLGRLEDMACALGLGPDGDALRWLRQDGPIEFRY